MADVPEAPKEGASTTSSDEKAILFLTEVNQAASGLQFALFTPAYRPDKSVTVQSQRLAALAVGGRMASGEALLDGPVPVGGIYQAGTPDSVDDDDVVTLLLDIKGRAIVVGAAAEDAAVLGFPVQVGGRYDATDRTLDDGDVGAVALDAAGKIILSEPGTVVTYNVTLTNANTEYSQALPSNCRAFSFRCRTAFDVRFAYVTGKVAGPASPYQTLKANAEYWKEKVRPTTLTLYLASSEAGVIAEIEAWS